MDLEGYGTMKVNEQMGAIHKLGSPDVITKIKLILKFRG